MKIFYITIIVSFLFCFNSCKDNSISESDKKEFYPLSVGNYWRYQGISFDSVGTVLSDSTYWLEQVIGDTTLKGERCYFLKQSGSPDSWFTAPYRNSSEGLIMQMDTTFTKFPLIYKYPVIINEMFSDSVKVIAVDEIISTIVGNMKCIVYQNYYSAHVTSLPPGWICMKTYVVPGFGKIGMDGFYTSDKIKLRKVAEYRIIDYKIN